MMVINLFFRLFASQEYFYYFSAKIDILSSNKFSFFALKIFLFCYRIFFFIFITVSHLKVV